VSQIADVKIGKITHYFDKIGVAVLALERPLSVGDKIKLVKGDEEFTQTVSSMQAEHKSIDSAKKGDDVGMKVDQPVKDGWEVFKISE